MQEIAGLVSVIIPAYNAEIFLLESIASVNEQSYPDWEIIIVNDGSTDGTKRVAEQAVNSKIKLVNQENKGVSVARNTGLQNALGEYLIFLDADDKMTISFIEARVKFLNSNPDIGFAGGQVVTFPVKSVLRRAAAIEPWKEILFFDANCSTVPSNYIFRRKVLLQNKVLFNTRLSSSADRFFILDLARYAKGSVLEDKNSELLYRVSENSMSNKVDLKLILDNEQFYKELIKAGLLPVENTARFKSVYFWSLAFGFAKVKHIGNFIRYLYFSFIFSPISFIKSIFKKTIFVK